MTLGSHLAGSQFGSALADPLKPPADSRVFETYLILAMIALG